LTNPVIRIPNRLAARTLARGGQAAGDSVNRAEQAIKALSEVSLKLIDDHLAEIARLYGDVALRPETGDLQGLYDRALDIIDVSSGLPDSGLEDAARAVCDLVSRSQLANAFDWEAVDVHLAALKVLRANGQTLTLAQRQVILQGLAEVTKVRAGPSDSGAGV
jgi:hypothetical protein